MHGVTRVIKNNEIITLPSGSTIVLDDSDTAVLQAIEPAHVIEIVKDDYSSQRE
ncbi:hypothetical protein D3C81_2316830 [compost metagenome]